MSYVKNTNQFNDYELRRLEMTPVRTLVIGLMASPPVVALRALAEIMLNSDEERLSTLLDNNELTEHWRNFVYDFGLDSRDYVYAQALENRLAKKN